MLRIVLLVGFLIVSQTALVYSAENRLETILANPGKIHLKMDFNKDFTVKKGHKFFKLGQATRWAAKDGVLVGIQSTAEYQAKKKKLKKGHLGTVPRLQFPNSPKDVIIKYSFMIDGGTKTKLVPMIEAGHHLRRIYFGDDSSKILVEHEKTTIAEDDFVLQLGKWYHIMLEIVGDEFLVRFQDGPTIYGKHPGVVAKFPNYNIGITATNKGTMYIDNMTIWHAGEVKSSWLKTKMSLKLK